MTFNDLQLLPSILKALKDENYTTPTSIQEKSIPLILDRKDVLGSAQTGTGKTAAFAIPIIQHSSNDKTSSKSSRKITTLVVTPTRELAIQIGESFSVYGKYTDIKNIALVEKYSKPAQVNSNLNSNSQTLHFGDIETNYTFEKAKSVKEAADMVKNYVEQGKRYNAN